jgi:hypothetical protein
MMHSYEPFKSEFYGGIRIMIQNNLGPSRRQQRRISLLVVIVVAAALLVPPFKATTDDFSIQTVQVIDLSAATANIQLLGAAADDHLSGNGSPNTFATFPRARALASGDINNDGVRDLIVGAPDVDFTPQGGSLRANAGAVYVLFGRSSFPSPTIVDTNLTALSQPDIRIFGAAADDGLGFAVAAGDVNGDGIDDLTIGAPGVDLIGTTPRTNPGAVYIIFGVTGLTPRTVDLSAPNASNVQIIGEQADDRFGSAMAIGDVNGGTSGPDLLVGAPASKGPDPVGAARANGGAAFLLPGGTGLANPLATTKVIDLNATPALVRIFGKAESQLGSSVAIGDVNEGAAGDLLVGAPSANRPDQGGDVSQTGATFGVFGGANITPVAPALTKSFDTLSTQQNLSIYGAVSGDHLGASIAAGNVTNEGASDLIIGAPQSGGPGNFRPACGQAYVIAGGTALNPAVGSTERRIDVSLATAALTVIGAAAGDRLGSCVAAALINSQGNTDSIPDVLLGAPGALSNRGSVHVLFGGSNLLIFPGRDLALNQDDLRVTGQAAADEFGWAIAAGDFDNNHGGDLAAGAPFADVQIVQGAARTNAGKVYVLLAPANTVPPNNQNPLVTLTAPNGGETVSGGTNFQIAWTASDPDGDNTIQSFELRLSTDGGGTFNTVIAANIVGTARNFTWAVPIGLNTTTARVRITVLDNAGGTAQDDSASNFTITDAGIALGITEPHGGESLIRNQTFTIKWVVGTGFEDLVKGFDLFFTTDGVTFTAITPVNPTAPALPAATREFIWTVPQLCTSTARIVVRATSVTGAASSRTSNAFSISEQGPQINTSNMTFNGGGTKLNFFIVANSQPLFLSGVKVEISTDETGATFFQTSKAKIQNSGTKLQARGNINGMTVGEFFPDGALRIIRITNPTCGITRLRVRRTGNTLVVEAALVEGTPIWQ